MGTRKGLKLRSVLIFLVTISVLLTAVIGGYFAWGMNRTSLTNGYLESNYQYAKKLTSNTSELLQIMHTNIEDIAGITAKQTISQKDLNIWFQASEHYFNAILIVNHERVVTAVSSRNQLPVVGTVLNSLASYQAVQQQKPLISQPYLGPTSKRLLVMISSPTFDSNGEYTGFVAGTIYLSDDNALNKLLSEHFYGNGSYVYVADKNGHLIFHPDKSRIYETVTTNAVINKAISGRSGAQQIMNSQEINFFAGYAYEPLTGWAIIAQTPASIIDEPLKQFIWKLIFRAIPVFIIILLIAWYVSYLLSKPLFELAAFSEEAILTPKPNRHKRPRINSYIYEVRQLNQSINNHFSLLNKEIRMDGLTGLANRKTFDWTITEWLADDIPFALILLDIDHFKSINDRYGHLTGDEVLLYTASKIRQYSRGQDFCFRYGGEEFGILVKYGTIPIALQMAERLREAVAAEASPTGSHVCISIGISRSDGKAEDAKEIIAMADKALYQSKEAGRNRTTIYEDNKKGQ
ncbi:sensor domain-containing diguanylate cyclase [Paenibacillus sinopodophylli]|uniref:sensor domain-containing diguanylate cyclase n=1 Tax=Paenibacillus sinopodophylli TaxID=1837342 RepID=UPI00110CDE88|nr:sensor domain-containing diguanylate cyclase [Paenibacillus sinopodophylli]